MEITGVEPVYPEFATRRYYLSVSAEAIPAPLQSPFIFYFLLIYILYHKFFKISNNICESNTLLCFELCGFVLFRVPLLFEKWSLGVMLPLLDCARVVCS